MKIKLMMGATLLMLVACATPSRFEWGQYENSLYTYYKKPETSEKFQISLEKAIEKGEKTSRLAPGLYAELGYLHLEKGDLGTAIGYFEKEAVAFPESSEFMKKIVNRLQRQDTKNAASNSIDENTSKSVEAETKPSALEEVGT